MIENYHLFIEDSEKLLQTALGKRDNFTMPSKKYISESRKMVFDHELASTILFK